MQLNDRFNEIFGKIPILGMIHLAGSNPIKRALEEIAIFEEEGVDGVIVENYHGSIQNIHSTLRETHNRKPNLVVGVNVLLNEFHYSLALASEFGADFVQLDHIAGTYSRGSLNFEAYEKVKEMFSSTVVLGGVWPKYYDPIEGSSLEEDLKIGMQRAEAIVVTGQGTGKETPLDKIRKFRETIGDHPLIVGAGLTSENAYEQLCLSNGAIVGTCFKVDDKTYNPLDRQKIKDFMAVVKQAREYR